MSQVMQVSDFKQRWLPEQRKWSIHTTNAHLNMNSSSALGTSRECWSYAGAVPEKETRNSFRLQASEGLPSASFRFTSVSSIHWLWRIISSGWSSCWSRKPSSTRLSRTKSDRLTIRIIPVSSNAAYRHI